MESPTRPTGIRSRKAGRRRPTSSSSSAGECTCRRESRAVSTASHTNNSTPKSFDLSYLFNQDVLHWVSTLKGVREVLDMLVCNLHEPRDWRLALCADVHSLPRQSAHFNRHLRSNEQLRRQKQRVRKRPARFRSAERAAPLHSPSNQGAESCASAHARWHT